MAKPYVILVSAILVLIGGYGVFWYVSAERIRGEVLGWRDDPPAKNMAIAMRDVEVGGFPYRFEITLEAPVLTVSRPDGPLVLRKESVVAVAQPWNWRHLIADLVGGYDVSRNDVDLGRVSVTRGLASVKLDEGGRLEQFSAEADQLDALIIPLDHKLSIEAMQLHARPSARPEGGLDLAASLRQIRQPDHPELPEWANVIRRIELDATLVRLPETPLNAANLAAWRDAGGSVIVRQAELKTDRVTLSAKGGVTLDRALRPQGQLNAEMSGYVDVVADLKKRGKLKPGISDKAHIALRYMAAAFGKVVAPLRLENGVASLGPLQLARLSPLVPDGGQSRRVPSPDRRR